MFNMKKSFFILKLKLLHIIEIEIEIENKIEIYELYESWWLVHPSGLP